MNQNSADMQKSIQKLLSTPEGKQLFKLLSADGGAALKSAGSALKAGNEAEAQAKIAPMLQNSEIQKLLKSLEKTMGHG